jgi:hypothetical protein
MMEKSPGGIYIPKRQEIHISAGAGAKLAARYSMKKGKEIDCIYDRMGCPLPGTGRDVVTGEIAPFNNVITNNGLDLTANERLDNNILKCHVGTGATAEEETDSILENFLTGDGDKTAGVPGQEATPPYFSTYVQTNRFGSGVAEGILSEVGMAPASTNGNLYSRSLIKDGGGTPTTIQILSDEWLDVVYEHRIYPDYIDAAGDPQDGTGTCTIDGVSYDFAIRPARLTLGGERDWWWIAEFIEGVLGTLGNGLYGRFYSSDAVIGAVTSEPSATDTDIATISGGTTSPYETYTPGTYNRDATWDVPLAEGNCTDGGGDGFAAILLYTRLGVYQMTYDVTSGGGPVPKDDTKLMTLTWNLAWDRTVIP